MFVWNFLDAATVAVSVSERRLLGMCWQDTGWTSLLCNSPRHYSCLPLQFGPQTIRRQVACEMGWKLTRCASGGVRACSVHIQAVLQLSWPTGADPVTCLAISKTTAGNGDFKLRCQCGAIWTLKQTHSFHVWFETCFSKRCEIKIVANRL